MGRQHGEPEVPGKPAAEGGAPAFESFLPFALPLIGKEEEDEVLDTLRSGWLTIGPKVARFEDLFRKFVGADHAVAVNSCTAALHLSLAALGIGPGDEVITTPVTFAATANVIIHQGARPVFVDIDPATLNIDVSKIEEKVTGKTRAIIPVHMAGRPCDMDGIHRIAELRGIEVIEDAAHAHGTIYKGRRIGTISRFTCFSFYSTKNITTIEGGVITTDDAGMAGKMRVMSLHGMTKDAWNRYSATGTQHWEIIYPGYKYNMTDVEASVGIHQMSRMDSFMETRTRHTAIYDSMLAGLEEVDLMPPTTDGVSSSHLYIIKLRPDKLRIDRDQFMEALRAENIGTGLHFRSLHLHPYYRETFGLKPGDLPVAADMSERIMSLPLYPRMDDDEVVRVAEAVIKLVNHYRA